MKEKYVSFWQWFTEKADYFYNNLEDNAEDIVLDITGKLQDIHKDLAFEITYDTSREGKILIISADGLIELFDIVLDLCALKPNLVNWEIIPFRPRLNKDDYTIDLAGISISYSDVYVHYEEYYSALEVRAYIKGYDGIDNRYVHAYFLLLDTLIGEFDAVTFIPKTDIFPYSKVTEDVVVEFITLRELIDNIKEKLGNSDEVVF